MKTICNKLVLVSATFVTLLAEMGQVSYAGIIIDKFDTSSFASLHNYSYLYSTSDSGSNSGNTSHSSSFTSESSAGVTATRSSTGITLVSQSSAFAGYPILTRDAVGIATGDVIFHVDSDAQFTLTTELSFTYVGQNSSSNSAGALRDFGIAYLPNPYSDRVIIHVATASLNGGAYSGVSTGSLLAGYEYELYTQVVTGLSATNDPGSISIGDSYASVNLSLDGAGIAVPEPSSFGLLGLGGIGLAIGAYRRLRIAVV